MGDSLTLRHISEFVHVPGLHVAELWVEYGVWVAVEPDGFFNTSCVDCNWHLLPSCETGHGSTRHPTGKPITDISYMPMEFACKWREEHMH